MPSIFSSPSYLVPAITAGLLIWTPLSNWAICAGGSSSACVTMNATVTVENDAIAVYKGTQAQTAGLPNQQILFGNLSQTQNDSETFPLTVGTFEDNGQVTIQAKDGNAGNDGPHFLLQGPGGGIPYKLDYTDCAGGVTYIQNGETVTLSSAGSSMVNQSSSSHPSCFPYDATAQPGAGAGLLRLTIAAPTDPTLGWSWIAGNYTGTLELTFSEL